MNETTSSRLRRWLLHLLPVGALVTVAAMGLAAWTLIRQHDQAEAQRREARNATVLLARAICEENAFFESVAMRGKTTAERAAIRIIFAQYNAPINKALRTLDAKPCERR